MRPRYENNASLEMERKIATVICEAFNVEVAKLPIAYRVDYAVLKDGEITAFLEVKHREIKKDTYPDIILALGKYLAGKELYERTGRRFIFAIGTYDGVFWTDLSESQYPLAIGGRVDRGDWQDIEPMIRIPMGDFHEVEYVNTIH